MDKKITSLAIVGIRGIPNNYGGFETLAEYLVEYLSQDMDITVYCSSVDMQNSLKTYKGASLKYIPVTSHGGLGILYDSIALIKAIRKYDKVLFLGFGGGFAMPFLKKYRDKIILNIGGLDWKRSKWSPFAQRVIRKAESLLVKNSGEIISDNKGIQDYILRTYSRTSSLIAYGGDQAQTIGIGTKDVETYPFLKDNYAFSVTRIQPDNNIDMILDAFSGQEAMPFVMVGNWNNSSYGLKTKSKYQNRGKLILLDAIYDREKLDVLRSNCTIYIHGHSAGGTNPSLVEAMYLGLPVFAYASGYNEYTTENKALYFNNLQELIHLISNYKEVDLKAVGDELETIANKKYRWKIVAEKYKELILR
jgi:glycosyltransferase involved in cell wall biosynthesis